jgi:hypothetical protein
MRTHSACSLLLLSLFFTLLLLALLGSGPVHAATYAELAQRNAQRQQPMAYPGYGNAVQSPGYDNAAGAYAQTGYAPSGNFYAGAGGNTMLPGNSALPMLPIGNNGMPSPRQMRWSYGQVNAASDPFNTWGLSTQGMYVPWSTPMSAWTNAQSWDWWRNRAGDAGPPPPLW